MAAQQIIKVANDMLLYYAGWVGKIHGESSNVVSDGLLGHYENYHNFTQLEPIGVAGLIIPWNGPFFVAMLKAAPALAAGCSCVLKPAEETPLTALKLEEIFREAGLPDGRLQRHHRLRRDHGCGARRASGRRQDRVHRVDGGRQADRQGGRGQPQAADA